MRGVDFPLGSGVWGRGWRFRDGISGSIAAPVAYGAAGISPAAMWRMR
jgi:hypothetical protein